jgi:hypothetical protein
VIRLPCHLTACHPLLTVQMCPSGRGFKRISCFNIQGAQETVTLVLWDSNHYDYLWLTDAHGHNPQY